MSAQDSEPSFTLTVKNLEKMIRSAVRDELAKLLKSQEGVFNIEPKTPLYEDMAEIAQMKKSGAVKIYSRQDVFGD